jgi:hypothetical protein
MIIIKILKKIFNYIEESGRKMNETEERLMFRNKDESNKE